MKIIPLKKAFLTANSERRVKQDALTGYEAWVVAEGITGGPLDDDDLDGLNNLSEYAVSQKPLFIKSVDVFNFVHFQRNDDPSLDVELQTCDDLVTGAWINTGYTILGTNITGGTYNEVTNSIPVDNSQTYIRLRIENQ